MGNPSGWEAGRAFQAQATRPEALSIPHSMEGVGIGAAAVRVETPSGGELPPGAEGVGETEAEKLGRWA